MSDYKPYLTADENNERTDKVSWNIILDRNRLTLAERKLKRQDSMIEALINDDPDLSYLTDSDTAYSKSVPARALPYAELSEIGGMCQKVNQLVVNGDFDDNSNWSTIDATRSVRNHKMTLTFTESLSPSQKYQCYQYVQAPISHKCLVFVTLTSSKNATVYLRLGQIAGSPFVALTANQRTLVTGIKEVTSADITSGRGVEYNIYASNDQFEAGDTLIVEKAQCADISAIWPTDTPTSTSDPRIAWLMSYLAEHPEYNAGSIIIAPVTNVASIGQGEIRQLSVGDKVVYIDVPALTAETSVWQGVQFRSPQYDPNKTYYGNRQYDYYIDRNVSSGSYQLYRNTETTYIKVWDLSVGVNTLPYVMETVTTNLPEIKNATKIINYPVHQAIQALDGYGWGVNENCYNYIDFDRKVFVKKVVRAGFATLTIAATSVPHLFAISDLSSVIKRPASNSEVANILTEKLNKASANAVYTKTTTNTVAVVDNGGVWIYLDNTYDTPEQVHAALDGGYLYYELAVPVETDISEYIVDDYIEVEAGGSVTFENDNNIAVPSTITYLQEAE